MNSASDEDTGLRAKASWAWLVHEVARLLKRRFEEEARAFGLTLPQWRALAQIAAVRECPQSGLSSALDADPMTVSGILDRLEKRGLVTRYPDPADSRAKLAAVTEEGARLVAGARSIGKRVFDDATAGVAPADREALERALGRIRENLLSDPAPLQKADAAAPEKDLH